MTKICSMCGESIDTYYNYCKLSYSATRGWIFMHPDICIKCTDKILAYIENYNKEQKRDKNKKEE